VRPVLNSSHNFTYKKVLSFASPILKLLWV
jgi:hypothetical protein